MEESKNIELGKINKYIQKDKIDKLDKSPIKSTIHHSNKLIDNKIALNHKRKRENKVFNVTNENNEFICGKKNDQNSNNKNYDFSKFDYNNIKWLPINGTEKLEETNLFYSDLTNCAMTQRKIILPENFPKNPEPIDYLNLFFTEELWQYILDKTNLYAHQQYETYDYLANNKVEKKEKLKEFTKKIKEKHEKMFVVEKKKENISKILNRSREEFGIIDYVDEDFLEHDDEGNICENANNMTKIMEKAIRKRPMRKFKRGNKKENKESEFNKYLKEKEDKVNNEDFIFNETNIINTSTINNASIISSKEQQTKNETKKEKPLKTHIKLCNNYICKYNNWKDVTIEELKTFHAIILWMGIHSNKDYKDNWSNDFIYASNISKFMSRNRFTILNMFLHLDNPQNENNKDKIFQLRYLIKYLNNVFIKVYTPSKFISINDCEIKCMQNVDIEYKERQSQGVKSILLCDNFTYYCIQIQIYDNKNYSNKDDDNKIISLLQNIIKLKTKHILYMDTKYTSYKISEYCRMNSLGFIGLINKEKININESQFPVIECTNNYFPAIKKRYAFFIDDKKNMTMTIFRDNGNNLCLLSNVTIPCFVKMENNNKLVKKIEVPNLVKDFSERAKSVEFCNQRSKLYKYPHKNVKLWKSVYYHLLHICISNAYTIYKIKNGDLNYKEFYTSIVKSLLGEKNQRKKVHAPNYIIPELRSKKRLTCRYCRKKKTEFMCEECSTPNFVVSLCIIDCFKKFHENGGRPAPNAPLPMYTGTKIVNMDLNASTMDDTIWE